MRRLVTLLILVSCCLFAAGDTDEADGSVSQLVRHLFDENYIPDVRPVCGKKPVTVKIGMGLRAILDVDEPSQVVSITVWLRLAWSDCRLKWNTTDYPVDELVVSSSRLWVPDITLFDSTGEGIEKMLNYRPIIYPNGTVFFMAPSIIDFSCKMDVNYFPYDRQHCRIKFASWSHDGHAMDVTNRSHEADTSIFVDNGEWNLLAMPARRNVLFYPCCKEPFPDVTFYLVIQRQYLYYFFNLVMPCVLITAIALLVFCLPPESGEKISLGITVLLSLCVFLLMVSERMPATSDSIPLIAQYFAATIVMASISCGMTVVVLNVHHHGQNGRKVPHWVRRSILDVLGSMLVVNSPKPCVSSQKDKEAQLMNPLLSSSESKSPDQHNHENNDLGDTEHDRPSRMEQTLEHIKAVLNKIKETFESREEQEETENEWRLVAMVLDRFFFLINSIMVLTVTLSLLLRSPSDSNWRDLDSWKS